MSDQSELRDDLCMRLLRYITDHDRGDALEVEHAKVRAIVACMGAAAVVLGTMPPRTRERVALEIDGKLLDHANHRAKEIRSGEFDRAVGGH